MFHRKVITPKVFIFLCILSNLVYAAKSVYVISSQDYGIIQPYRVDANHITLQANVDTSSFVPNYGPVGIAICKRR